MAFAGNLAALRLWAQIAYNVAIKVILAGGIGV